jgi:predicted Zn-dependent protease
MVAAPSKGLSPKTRWVLLAVAAALLLGPLAVLLHKRAAPPKSAEPEQVQRYEGPEQACTALASAKTVMFQDLINCSQLMIDQHHVTQSLPLLDRAAEMQPQSALVHNNLCVAYGLLGDRERAVRECATATALDPKFELARNNLRWVSQISAGGSE